MVSSIKGRGLTSRSSRSRFAARLNSGVRRLLLESSASARFFGNNASAGRRAPATFNSAPHRRALIEPGFGSSVSGAFSGAFAPVHLASAAWLHLWLLASSLTDSGRINSVASGSVATGGGVVGSVLGKCVQTPRQHRLTSHSSRSHFVARLNSGARPLHQPLAQTEVAL
mgnify:CR=1 FL=1